MNVVRLEKITRLLLENFDLSENFKYVVYFSESFLVRKVYLVKQFINIYKLLINTLQISHECFFLCASQITNHKKINLRLAVKLLFYLKTLRSNFY